MNEPTETREITLVDRVAAAAFDSPLMHLTGSTGEERLMIATADRILAMPEMQQLKELARYGRYEYDNDGVPCRWETEDWLAASSALREWLIS